MPRASRSTASRPTAASLGPIRYFPLNLAILVQNENDWNASVAEGKSLPQKVLEKWKQEHATSLDQTADGVFRGLEDSRGLPQSDRSIDLELATVTLRHLVGQGSALAARHLAALALDPDFGNYFFIAETDARKAIKLGCEPAWYQLLATLARQAHAPRTSLAQFENAARMAIERDECVLLLGEHVQTPLVDAPDLNNALRDRLARLAKNGSIDALRFLFLGFGSSHFTDTAAGLAGETLELLRMRARTDIFCARLFAQYKVGMLPWRTTCFGDADEEGNGTDLQQNWDQVRNYIFSHTTNLRLMRHEPRLIDNWERLRVHFEHAASLGDPWSELVLHVNDALWPDCPHDAMARLFELADRKEYPLAMAFVGALRFNLGEDTDEVCEYVKKAAEASPDDPRPERIWLDMLLLRSRKAEPMRAFPLIERRNFDGKSIPLRGMPALDEEIDSVWDRMNSLIGSELDPATGGLGRLFADDGDEDESIGDDGLETDGSVPADWADRPPVYVDDPDASLVECHPCLNYMRNRGTEEEPVWWGQLNFLLDLPTDNPHLAAIRDRAGQGSPYAAFLLGRAIIDGRFGNRLKGRQGYLLCRPCLEHAISHDVEEAVLFAWALFLADNDSVSTLLEPVSGALYHAVRYPSLCRVFMVLKELGMDKWGPRLPGRPLEMGPLNLTAIAVLQNFQLVHEPMGAMLEALRSADAAVFNEVFNALGELFPVHPEFGDQIAAVARDTKNYPQVIAACLADAIQLALDRWDLPTLILLYACLHHLIRAQAQLTEVERARFEQLFCALSTKRGRQPLKTLLANLASWMQNRDVDLKSLRNSFPDLRDPESERRLRRTRQKKRERAKKRKR